MFCVNPYSFFAELIPARVRFSALSLSFNLATILGGGLTPFVATWLVQATGHPVAPAFYVVAAAAVGLLMVLASAETSKQRLE